jgi:hypothetical protein
MGLKFRRGTTAQKSGSLAFGEPYVNTDLGTLQIGGATGDITLGASGTGSQGSFAGISGSSLDITGNAKIDGNLTLGGQLTIGDQTSDTVNVVASLSSSLIPQTTNAFDLGSETKIWRDLYISTGSIKFVANNAIVSTLSVNANGSQTFPSGAVVTGSLVTTGSKVEFNVQWPTAPAEQHIIKTDGFTLDGRNYEYAAIALEHYEDAPGTYHNAISTYMFDSGSNFGAESLVGPYRTHIRAYPSGSGGSIANVSVEDLKNGTTQALVYGDFVQIGAYHAESIIIGNSGSVTEMSGSIRVNSLTGSIAATNGVVSGSSQLTSTFAGLNTANTFTGNQTITGSLYIANDLVVQGSASIQTISSSRLDIGDNIIQLNVNSPSLRYGGIEVYDSGSAGSSGSFLYDSLHDEFIFVHKGNGINVTSSHFVLGPETYDNLGTETYLTNNRLPKGSGKEHLNDSNITDTGTLITLGSNTTITGTLSATGTTLVSSSIQIDATATTNFATGVKTELNSNTVISGSSQVDATATTNFATGVKTQLNSNTVVSGSSQITLSSTTGGGTGASIQFGSLGIGMAASGTTGRIDASGDIVAYSTSDKNFKENITPIENPIEKIRMISGNTYDWKVDMKEFHGFEGNDVGVIAQEIEAVLPQLVTTRETGYKAVKYDKLVALLIEGIKAQQNQIDNLTIEIEKLKESKGL